MYRISGSGSGWPDNWPFFLIRFWLRLRPKLYQVPDISVLFVPSERLFSTAGGVITERRARLLPDNAERLIFLKYNVSLIKLE